MDEIKLVMTEIITTYLEPFLLFVTGGGLASLISIKYTRKTAQADAMKAMQDVYQETIQDLRNDKEEMKKEIAELKKEVHQNSEDIKTLKSYKCTALDCKLRKRE